jgi:hypothetical protein
MNCGGMKLIGEIHRRFVQRRRSRRGVGSGIWRRFYFDAEWRAGGLRSGRRSGIRGRGLERGGGSRLAGAFFVLDRRHEI